jgi:hypothetical protein
MRAEVRGDGRAVALAYSLELGRRLGPCVQRDLARLATCHRNTPTV